MTTTERPDRERTRARTLPVLLVAGLCVVGVVAVAALVGLLVSGSAEALGVLVGGGIALAFFVFGSVTVAVATRAAPQMSLLVALMTFTLQMVLVAAVFAVLASSGLVGDTLSPGWVAGGVVVAAAAWTIGQLVGSARARVLAYDIELPGHSHSRAEGREVGAS